MRLLIKTISVGICVCICFCLSSCSTAYKNHVSDYDTGYYEGYDSGYEEGFDYGFDEGYNEAELEYEDSYSEGYSDGYQAGATYACLYFGDEDRAFKCAREGSAWYTFIDAYDQYIYDIYDDDDKETRSKLFWALYHVTSGKDVTEEEIDLLIKSFGSYLFIQNDIDF